jgi:hypothetical protein
MQGKYPKENILHKEHGESLKSRNNNTHCNFTVSFTSINSYLMLPFYKHDQAHQDTYKKSMNVRETEVRVSLIFSGCNALKYLKSQ